MSDEYKIPANCQKCQKLGHISNYCETYITLTANNSKELSKNNVLYDQKDQSIENIFQIPSGWIPIKITGNQVMYSRKLYETENLNTSHQTKNINRINTIIALEA